MLSKIHEKSIELNLTAEDKWRYTGLEGNQKKFKLSELEKELVFLRDECLATFRESESSGWGKSNFFERSVYYIDFFNIGENAKSHYERARLEKIIDVISKAIDQLREEDLNRGWIEVKTSASQKNI